ncbi:MAG: PAS domain-containing protein [Opitutales bacterium]|nr:PAS domain-containing protein [Opitutales bacterium]
MWMIAAISLAALSLWLGLRLRYVARLLGNLEHSARSREPLLIEKRTHVGISRQIDSLHDALNALITESRHGRNQDRDYLHQIETTLGSIKEAVLILDDSHYVRMANDAARQLIGPDKELLGRRVESLLPSVSFLDYVRSLWKGRKSGAEVIEMVKGEDQLWFEVTGALIVNEESHKRLALFVLHDITKLKQLENMRTEFVANVSHELRTPVTVIRGFTDTLLDDNATMDAEDRLHFLRKIQRNVVRLNSLLEDLLTLSRMEGRSSALKPEFVNLNSIVGEACDNYSDRKPDGIELVVELDPAIPSMNLDPLRITQVIENLLDNATRHAKGMKTLRVTTRLANNMLRCEVQDDGCGIPVADIPHIFERFYRVDKGRSRELGGTGLGLAIVKHIIFQHGGKVQVQSKEGRGTTMCFDIPVEAEKAK